jgi:hypothetical protein
MTVPSNLYQKASLKGDREDLLDKIFNTDPTETPVLSGSGRQTATNTLHEWQRDGLATANKDNAMVDGDDVTLDAQTPTERVGNYPQIFSKKPGTSRRANLVKKAGRGSEQGYIRGKAMLEIKRDIEAMILSNNLAVAPTTSVAAKSGGLGIQLYVNALHGGAGATPAWTTGAPTAALTGGTNRAFTVTLMNTACQNVFGQSGKFVEMAVMSPSHKATFSGFAGIAANRFEVKGKSQGVVVAGADVFMSDFGAISIVPHWAMVGATDVFLLNTEFIDTAWLDGFQTSKLGKSGDSERELITADVCLAVRASKAQAKIANLTP